MQKIMEKKYSWTSYRLKNILKIEDWLLANRHLEYLFFLDSSCCNPLNAVTNMHLHKKSRYSYIGLNPHAGIEYYGDKIMIYRNGKIVTESNISPNECLKIFDSFCDDYSTYCNPHNPEREPQWFTSLSYDFGEFLVGTKKWDSKKSNDSPYYYCWLPSDQLVIDWQTGNMVFWSLNISDGENIEKRFIDIFDINLNEVVYHGNVSGVNGSLIFNKASFITAIEKIRHYIFEGDVYLVNMTQPFYFESNSNLVDIYINLRKNNPSPFGALLITPTISILSSSPERFIYVNNNVISTEPIKGTRPRGKTPVEDDKYLKDLISSEKEKAEHTMVVDLLRNEIGKLCVYGSVFVEDSFYVEKYNTVFQLISRIKGKLLPNVTFSDIISETFPGGSVTGSPKFSSMKIIGEVEQYSREYYTGCLGRRSISNENYDLSILIRSFVFKANKAMLGVGGGIIYDSVSDEEYQETLDKGRIIVESLNSEELSKVFCAEDQN